MSEADWSSGFGRSVAVYLNGDGIADRDLRGERVVDESFLLAFSAHDEAIDFRLPPKLYGRGWQIVIDTAEPDHDGEGVLEAGQTVSVGPRALVVLQKAT
jgi:glycogen operon protein